MAADDILQASSAADDVLQAFLPLPIAAWTVVYCLLCAAYDPWARQAGYSSYGCENNRYDFTQKAACIIHASLVGVPGLIAYVALECSAEDTKFFADERWLTGDMDKIAVDTPGYMSFQVISLCGAIFLSFLIVDLAFSVMSGLATLDSIVHHVAFMAAGMLIGGNRILFYNSAALLSMELSSPFLNCVLLYRNRGDQYKSRVTVAGGCFLFTYFVLRILVGTRSTLVLLRRGAEAFPARVPAWQRLVVQAALISGMLLQFWWLPKIWRTFGARAVEFLRKGKFEATDAVEGRPAKKPE